MDLHQLETFLAVAEEKSFSKAAARLHRTQPAVSQIIRKLEADLGEPLFERASRDGSLTAPGELLKEYAERILRLRTEASSALAQLKALDRGSLRLAANEYTCLYLLLVLDVYRRQYPQIDVEVHRSLASRVTEELDQRTVEMGVLSFRPPEEHYRSIAVYSDELAFVVNPRHPLAKEGRVSISDLGAENFVAHNVPSPLRRHVIDAFARHRTPLNMTVKLPSLEAIKRFVAMGNGVALVPGLTVSRELDRGDLVRVTVPELELRRQLRLVHRRQATLSYAAVAFLKCVRALASERGVPFLYHVDRAT